MGLRGPGAKGRGRPRMAGPVEGKKAAKSRKPAGSAPLPVAPIAERVIAFCEGLLVTSGKFAGKRLQLRDWQKQIVRAIYREVNGSRPVRTALITMPRKNGKTQLAAALALCHMLGPTAESRGQVYSAAADQEQAGLIFNEMEALILADEALVQQTNIQRFHKKIEVLSGPGAGTVYKALTADARKAHGLSPSFAIYDELAQAPNRMLYDNLRSGTGARENPLFIVISTQSPDPLHVMSEVVDYAQDVKAGKVNDPHFFGFIAAAPDNADPWNEDVWGACNPALGDFRSLEDMRIKAAEAKVVAAQEPVFRNHFLNQRVDVSAVPWIGRDPVEQSLADLNLDDYAGRDCYMALDLSGKHDLTALELVFPHEAGADCFAVYWTPKDTLKDREQRDRVPYRDWVIDGYLETVPGKSIDYAWVAQYLAGAVGRFNVLELAFDRWRIDDLLRELTEAGIEAFVWDGKAEQPGLKMVPFGQGFRDFSPALDVTETALINQKLRIQRNPITLNHASNCIVEMDAAGNRKFTKKKATGRIDGMVALAMGVKRALGPIVQELSVYESIAKTRAQEAAKKPIETKVRPGSSVYEHLARNKPDGRRQDSRWEDD